MAGLEILRIENLSFKYPKTEKAALNSLSLSVQAGSFTVICGESGCGKTTLLKLLKPALAPAGEQAGAVYFENTPLDRLSPIDAACSIGFVLQNPDNQIVTDKVWHELSFGLENMGLPPQVIKRRVAEMASYFGIQDWFRQSTDQLSGGQKQLLNLASVMVMQPKLLLLDEPTGQLDPIAASEFIATLQKMNRELGLTILLVEHRLEEVLPLADRVLLLEQGGLLLYDKPNHLRDGLRRLSDNHPMLEGLPAAVRIFSALEDAGDCPLTVREGRQALQARYPNPRYTALPQSPAPVAAKPAAELKGVWFRYGKALPDILRGVNLRVNTGELFCILGGNGTGKTTALRLLAGLSRPYRGKMLLHAQPVALLPQNPQALFVGETVAEELEEAATAAGLSDAERTTAIQVITETFHLSALLSRHPYDLSGGEQQKCALAKLLLGRPRLLLLDEPTKGFDPRSKKVLADILKRLKQEGTTVIVVTHDVEFAAEQADRCALFFDGEILAADTPQAFFSGNRYYTTAANRISSPCFDGAVTCAQVLALCRKNGDSHA